MTSHDLATSKQPLPTSTLSSQNYLVDALEALLPKEQELSPRRLAFTTTENERLAEQTDLRTAIAAARQILDVMPPGDSIRADHLDHLSSLLQCQYERTRVMDHLDQAIQAARQAIDLTPTIHLNFAKYSNNLGGLLSYEYEQRQDVSRLEQAVDAMQQAVDSTQNTCPDWAIYSKNLSILLKRLYKRTRATKTLKQAIVVARQSLYGPTESPARSTAIDNSGEAHGETVTDTLGERRDMMKSIVSKLQLHLGAVQDYLNSVPPAKSEMADEKAIAEQCLVICAAAEELAETARSNVVSDVSAGENSQQLLVTTVGDLISSNRISVGARSTQSIGSMTESQLLALLPIARQAPLGQDKV